MVLPSRQVAAPDCQLNWEAFTRWSELFAPSALVTSLPADPVDGQVINYDTGTDGVVWHFRYDAGSASAYKWQFVGGAPLYNEVTTDQGTASGVPTDLATVGPSLTNPLAGDWIVEFGANMYSVTNNSAQIMALQVGGAGPADANAGILIGQPAGSNTAHASGARVIRRTAIAASSAWVPKYWQLGGGTGQFRNRWITLTPIRVG